MPARRPLALVNGIPAELPTADTLVGAGLSASAAIGYVTGAGGAITQITSRTTGVTLNTACGNITLFTKTTTAQLVESFTVINTFVAAGDTINVVVRTGTGIYFTAVTAVGAGTFRVSIFTPAAVGTAEGPTLSFSVIKAVSA